MLRLTSPRRSPQLGFTMIEILISTTILMLAMGGIVLFLAQELRVYYYDSNRLSVNHDIRKFTQDLARDVDSASYFMIFPDYSTRISNSKDGNVLNGGSGDFLLLVSCAYCVPDSSGNPSVNGTTYTGLTLGKNYIYRMVGYYRDTTGSTTTPPTGPVRRVQYDFATPADPTAAANQPTPIATLMNSYLPTSAQTTNPIVVQLAQGLAAGTLFYNYGQVAVLVRAQIQENGNLKNAVNTYTFTVAPRG